MIDKIDFCGNNYKIEDSLKKYAQKKLGKLDRYLPKKNKKDVVCKVVVSAGNKGKNDKYEISVAMEIPGGKVLAARDQCTNIFAGVDLVEAKIMGQIRRYKMELQQHQPKRSLKNLFRKR